MAYLDSIIECNLHDLGRFLPFVIGETHLGWVRRDMAPMLEEWPDLFAVTERAITLSPTLSTPEQRTRALDAIAPRLIEKLGLSRLHGEHYPACRRWGEPAAMTIDRALVPLFGIPSHGVHVSGYLYREGKLFLWIGRRSMTKSVAPGKLDNIIAGGQPHDLSIMENLVKEAAEEADMPRALALTARPVGLISYAREDNLGLRPDVMFCFDLEVPPDFTPRNTDGEITDFMLMPVEEVAALVRDTKDFKLNVNLVIIDFLVRHGILTPDTEPDYVEIAGGLRQPFPIR